VSRGRSPVSRKLAAWFERNGRDLPWRRRQDEYSVAVSEFMLQQTQVSTVIPYFERWMRLFPDWRALAAANEQEVLSAWAGLGYYRRARNLHQLARTVMEKHGGELPGTLEELRALPGIGDYTAAAILAFARDRPAAVVDANIARVLARLFDYRQPIDTAAGRKFLHDASWKLQLPDQGRLLNSALMELGALLCKPSGPDCLLCPVKADCRAGDPNSLPVTTPKPTITRVEDHRLFVADGRRVWLEQSEGPRWKGLWLLPQAPADGTGMPPPIYSASYSITRYRVQLQLYAMKPAKAQLSKAQPIELTKHPHFPMPAPYRKALEAALMERAAARLK